MQSLPKRTRETRFDLKQATEIEKQGLFNVLEEYMQGENKMRLWHEQIIHLLPKNQLLVQHRECCTLRGNGWKKILKM